jgi:hypothetical protein
MGMNRLLPKLLFPFFFFILDPEEGKGLFTLTDRINLVD